MTLDHLPRSQAIWIMEVLVHCKDCYGTGREVPPHPDGDTPECDRCNGSGRSWYGVHSGNGKVYTYLTRTDAARMLCTCFPQADMARKLGASDEEAGARVTECAIRGDRLVRVEDGRPV